MLARWTPKHLQFCYSRLLFSISSQHVFESSGNWSVVQQAMNSNANTFRRYHWYSKWLTDGSVLELHSCMISELNFGNKVLGMTNKRYPLKIKEQLSI